MVDIQDPLRRGIFVVTGIGGKVWVPFKYEKLPFFYFGCGRMGHNVSDCDVLKSSGKQVEEENYRYLLSLRAETKLLGKESFILGVAGKIIFCHHDSIRGRILWRRRKR